MGGAARPPSLGAPRETSNFTPPRTAGFFLSIFFRWRRRLTIDLGRLERGRLSAQLLEYAQPVALVVPGRGAPLPLRLARAATGHAAAAQPSVAKNFRRSMWPAK